METVGQIQNVGHCFFTKSIAKEEGREDCSKFIKTWQNILNDGLYAHYTIFSTFTYF